MDFLSSMGLGGEFQTPVGSSIERATSENLVSADWGLNMQICDEINRRTDGPSHAAKALRRRLRSESNPKVLQLTLTLCEAVVKNCDRALHQAIGTREFLTEVVGLTNGQKGYEVRSQALALIQEWGIAFQSDRSLAFGEIYGRAKAQGARFPPVEGAAPVFTPPLTSRSTSGSGGMEERVTTPQTMEKLEADLQMVSDKITLCRQMLPESPGVANDEALSEVVGFLEACRPRMVDLVEAGIGGSLGEDTFNKCLQINDALLRTLDAEREGTPIAVEDGLGGAATGSADLLDLDGGSDDPLSGKMSTFSIGEADEEDDFAQLRNTKTTASTARDGRVTKLGAVPLKSSEPATAASATIIKPAAADDDLDDFLNSLEGEVGVSSSAAGTKTGVSKTSENTNADDDDLERFLA